MDNCRNPDISVPFGGITIVGAKGAGGLHRREVMALNQIRAVFDTYANGPRVPRGL